MQRVAAEPLDVLRTRTSSKWRSFAPDVLPLPIAEMDYPLAEPMISAVSATLSSTAPNRLNRSASAHST